MKEQELSALKESAVYSAAHWAKTGFGYFTMRDKVNAYIDATGANKALIKTKRPSDTDVKPLHSPSTLMPSIC